MASITIRRIDERVKSRLRLQAAGHGRSMEEEARQILKNGLGGGAPAKGNLAESIRRHFAPFGGVELKRKPREPGRRRPDFSE
jgi:plasmid stability protein